MVLITPEAFYREVLAFISAGEVSDPATHIELRGPYSVLVLSTCDVDGVCCSHMLQLHLWARSLYNDAVQGGRDIAVDVEFFKGVKEALAWLDRLIEVQHGQGPVLPYTSLSFGAPRSRSEFTGKPCSSFRLPFYDRIFLIGMGGCIDSASVTDVGAGARLCAALTDVLLQRALQQRAWDELRRIHGLGGAEVQLQQLPEEMQPQLQQQQQKIERELARHVRVVVVDPRRPVQPALLKDERWLLLVDEGETEAIYAEGALQAAKASTNRGLYSSKPSAMLLAAALPPLYPLEGGAYAFCAATAAASALQQDVVAIDAYNEWILAVRRLGASSFQFLEDDANGGLLPLLRNGCLEESLRLSPELLFKAAETEWGGWQQRQQHLANQLRVRCGIACKEMGLPFGGLSTVQRRTVFSYLRQTIGIQDRFCISWIRHIENVKERGTFSSVPNTDAAWLLGAVLSKERSGDTDEALSARLNAIDALQLLKGLTTASVLQKASALDLLQSAQGYLYTQRSQLYQQRQHSRGGSTSSSRRWNPVVLVATTEGPPRALIYCCTPGADKEEPDLFPKVLAIVERRNGGGGSSSASGTAPLYRDAQEQNLLHVLVQRLAADVAQQIAAVYLDERRRREEQDAENDGIGNEEVDGSDSEEASEEEALDAREGAPSGSDGEDTTEAREEGTSSEQDAVSESPEEQEDIINQGRDILSASDCNDDSIERTVTETAERRHETKKTKGNLQVASRRKENQNVS